MLAGSLRVGFIGRSSPPKRGSAVEQNSKTQLRKRPKRLGLPLAVLTEMRRLIKRGQSPARTWIKSALQTIKADQFPASPHSGGNNAAYDCDPLDAASARLGILLDSRRTARFFINLQETAHDQDGRSHTPAPSGVGIVAEELGLRRSRLARSEAHDYSANYQRLRQRSACLVTGAPAVY